MKAKNECVWVIQFRNYNAKKWRMLLTHFCETRREARRTIKSLKFQDEVSDRYYDYRVRKAVLV